MNLCLSDLEKMKTTPGQYQTLLSSDLTRDPISDKLLYKGHEVTGCRETDPSSAINSFIDNLIDNIKTRFVAFALQI